MDRQLKIRCTSFEGSRCIASGELAQVALIAKETIDQGGTLPVLIFNDSTGDLVDVDFRSTADDVRRRLEETADPDTAGTDLAVGAEATPRGPGRPKLGVVSREVTLLPRHWDWLNNQPGGASVALRKLVEKARRDYEGRDRIRLSQEAANRFMSAMAGDLAGFEEATRALFAGKRDRFDELIEAWPADVRDFAKKLAAAAFADS